MRLRLQCGMRHAVIYIAGFLTAASASPASVDLLPESSGSAFSARFSDEVAKGSRSAVSVSRASDGLFYVDAAVRSGSLRFLVDTGATHVIMSHADAELAGGRAVSKKYGSIQTAGGPIAVRWIVVDRMVVAGSVLQNVEAAVPEKDVGLSLLGQNALAQFTKLEINGDDLLLMR